eukprot:7377622-Prymnesium_polylepis.3
MKHDLAALQLQLVRVQDHCHRIAVALCTRGLPREICVSSRAKQHTHDGLVPRLASNEQWRSSVVIAAIDRGSCSEQQRNDCSVSLAAGRVEERGARLVGAADGDALLE